MSNMPAQRMTYKEREQLKRFANAVGGDAATMLVCIAHWFREPNEIPFTDYLEKWLTEDTGFELESLIATWEDNA